MSDISISYKGNTIATMDATGTKTLLTSGKYCEDDISIAYTKPSGGVSQPSNDVNFIDYDGTIVASYSAADFANLSAMPDNPTHTGLTAQGWNWTLADAKAQVLISGGLDIGQMYITDDGKTRLYITLFDSVKLSPTLYFNQSVSNGVEIDWGDGSSPETISGTGNLNVTHTYSRMGDYVITLNVTNGTLKLGNGSTSVINSSTDTRYYRSILTNVEVGSNCSFQNNSFNNAQVLKTITIPKTTTNVWVSSLFTAAQSLRCIVVPDTVTTIGSEFARGIMYTLQMVSLPKSLVTVNYTNQFIYCYNLKRITLPPITSIQQQMFMGCETLTKLVIPSSVTNIGASAFSGCYSMGEMHFKSTTPPTVADSNAFTNVPTTCKIYVPSGYKSAYTSANNYPSSSTYTYIEE